MKISKGNVCAANEKSDSRKEWVALFSTIAVCMNDEMFFLSHFASVSSILDYLDHQ
jgi:hypothetical protein